MRLLQQHWVLVRNPFKLLGTATHRLLGRRFVPCLMFELVYIPCSVAPLFGAARWQPQHHLLGRAQGSQ